MSFLDEVILPNKTSSALKPASTSKNSFLDSVVPPPEGYVAPTPTAPVVKPTLLGALKSGIKQTGSDFMSAVKGDLSQVKNAFTGGIQQANQGAAEARGTSQNPSTLLQRAEGTATFAGGLASAAGSFLAPSINPPVQFLGNAIANAPRLNPNVPTAFENYGTKYATTPPTQATPLERGVGAVANVAGAVGAVAGGIEGVRSLTEKPPIEAPNGGTGTGTYPPATIRADTPVESSPITTDTKLTNPSIGKIEVIQGRPTVNGASGFGLAKIVGDHPDVLPHIEEGLKNAQVTQELPQRTILESPQTDTSPPIRYIVDHQLGTEPKTFLNNAYVLREGFEPPTSPASRERSTTELSKQTENTPTLPKVPEKSMNTTQESTPVKTGRTTQTLKPIEGTGDIKTRGLSQGVEAGAIEKKLTDTFGDLPEYKQVNMKEQADKASDFISNFPDEAREVALGNKAPPKGLLPESVFVAAERKALAESDVETLKDLANSKLAASATTMGQRIRTLGERDENSPLKAIQDIQKAREEAAARRNGPAKKAVKSTVDDIKKEIQKATPKKQSWNDFIDTITC